ncbi:MAG: DivIVA domain-containing protein [Armatimonadetes bacterium]|nr:MAG: DivIVA domain-containing protein [Armatimonadota bacterium]MCE7900584.1 DivIVA domain-containing protein [Armatimonadetes bacterium ATM1]MDL1929357.1 DivIVA domain-containing protein [Fimbriimonadia bacterium ATM]MBC6970181.1 DivIVA domain-containing protein [Armatimonadota bacterium]MBL1149933.1 DivIVA domain-containing protein [Armatimonadota bacterium]
MSKGHIKALDIEKKEFSTGLRGYNSAEVDAFLERIAAEVERLSEENAKLTQRAANAEAECQRLRLVEEKLRDAFVHAQTAADEIKASARKEAELILREAEVERVRIAQQIESLRAERDAFVAQLRGITEAFASRLDSVAAKPGEASRAESA